MSCDRSPQPKHARDRLAWDGFQRASGRRRSTSATSSSRTTSRTTATRRSSRRRPQRTRRSGSKLNELFVEERKKGVLDVSQIPSSITAHAPGYIDRDNEIIVGLQTDAPLKRAIMPNGGFRMVAERAQGLRLRARSARRRGVHQVPQDAQRRRVRRLHRRHPALPQLAHPDRPARRLRPRPDHRRLPPRRALRRRPAHRAQAGGEERASIPRCRPTRSSAIARSCPSRSARSRNCSRWPRATASTSRARRAPRAKPCSGCTSAIWPAVKEQNGAAMSLGRTSTFLDIYFERDLAAGTLTEAAGAGDRRRLRHQAAHRPLPAHAGVRRAVRRRSDLGHRVDRRHGRRRPVAGHEDELPLPADALQPRPRAGAEPHDLVFAAAAGRVPAASPRRSPSTPARSSSRATRSCAAPGATTAPSPAACRRC